MAGLFGGAFAPNTGWLGSAMPQQEQPQEASLLDKLGLLFTDPFGAKVPFPGGAMSPGSDLNRLGLLLTDPFGSRVPFPGAIGTPQGQPPAPGAQLPMNVSGMPQPANNAGMSQFPGAAPQISSPQPQQDAAIPPQARPTQGVAPPQMQQQAPSPSQPEIGIGQRFNTFANNLSSGGNPLAMLSNVAQGLVTGQRFDAEGKRLQNQQATMQAVAQSLIQRGYSPQIAVGMAQAASIDPKIAEKILGDAYAIPKTAEELAVRRASMPGGDQGQGNPFDILTQKTAATKAGEVQGERTATAQLDLPSAVAQANEALRLVGELRTHKGRDNPVFWHSKVGGYLPDAAVTGNTDAKDALSILNQIKGGAFLEAFKALKGGGQITEVEGRKATDAITRMDRSQSRAEFDRALSDYEGIIKLGIDRANQQAGRPAPGGFKGNSDWQQVRPGVRIRQVQ